MRIGLFVDTSDLYRKILKKFNGKLCYEAYHEQCSKMGRLIKAVAYGMQNKDGAQGFINCLKMTGFETKFKEARVILFGDYHFKQCSWDVSIVLDVIKLIDRLDIVIFGSSNVGLLPLIEHIRAHGIQVVIFATNIPKILKDAVDSYIEITEDMLEEDADDETD